MAVEMSEIGIQIRKFVFFSVSACYRSVCNHPFLAAMVFLLFCLYRSFPFLFSLLVSASPVIICTAILLGTLLSFGHPNIPEIEEEEKITHEIVSLKTGIQRDATVVERDESFAVENYTAQRRDVVERSIEEGSSTVDRIGEVDKSDGRLVDFAPQMEDNSRETQLEKGVIEEAERELHDSGIKMRTGVNEEKLRDRVFLENQYSRMENVEDGNAEFQHDKSPAEPIDSRMADSADTPPGSPWKRVGDEEEEVDDEASDTGSDRAESSSPDASMADIMPMLDELHPLLDEEAPQAAHMSHDGSDASSERSQKSSHGSDVSDEDSENHEEEVGDDNDDEEEEKRGGNDKDDATKSAITWTEDDQKNLMDLGTLELERNQRLENLIARRRARRMMTEKNLIDLESADLPFDIAPISTARRNPFDLPYDSNDNNGLPPIPGSAPSIMLQRHNPFDLPYDPTEEKPDLMEDSFQQEFMPCPPKDAFFRRHESFNVGPSFFGPPKQEKLGMKFKPFFVPERMASEGTSYSSLHRQSSELSDSKVSSVPETDSICSAGDQDDMKLIEEDFSQEAELISDLEHPSEHVGHGSESSEDVDVVESSQAEKRDIEHDEVELNLDDVGSHSEIVASFAGTPDLAITGEHDTGEIQTDTGADEVNYSSRSSSSSLSEGHERIFDDKEDGVLSSMEPKMENAIEESGISSHPSLEESKVNITIGLGDDSHHKEPVYDSSPPAFQKNLSSSSISSDLQVETLEMGFSPVLVKRMVSFADRDTKVINQSLEMDTSGNEQGLADLSDIHPVDKSDSRTTGVAENAENIYLNHGVSGAPITLNPSAECEVVENYLMYQNGSYQHEQGAIPSSSTSTDIDVVVHQVVVEDIASAVEEQPSVVFEQASGIHYVASSSENESIEEQPLDKEVDFQMEQDQFHSSSSNGDSHVGIDQEGNEERLSSYPECVSEEKPMYALEEHLPLSDKAMVELSSENHEVLIEPSIIQVKPIAEISPTSYLDASEVPSENNVSMAIHSPSFEVFKTRSPEGLPDVNGVENPDHIQVQPLNLPTEANCSQVHEQYSVEEADEIKEIDEGLLMELDTVGDFSVTDLGSNLNEVEDNRLTGQEMSSEMHVVDAQSEEDIEFILRRTEPVPMNALIGEFEIPHQAQNELVNSGLPVLEVQSLEDIHRAFSKISAEEVKKTVVESLHAELIAEESTVGCSKFGLSRRGSNLSETTMEVPVVEERSIEDIDLADEQLHKIERDGGASSVDDRPDVMDFTDPEETYSDLHVEELSKPGFVNDSPNVSESKDPAETISDLHVSEPRSLQDTDMALTLGSEGNVDNLLKSDLNDGLAKSASNEVGPSEEMESSIKAAGVPETNTSTAEQPDGGAQTSDDSILSTSDDKGKNHKPHKLSSNSSSSSSDSE